MVFETKDNISFHAGDRVYTEAEVKAFTKTHFVVVVELPEGGLAVDPETGDVEKTE